MVPTLTYDFSFFSLSGTCGIGREHEGKTVPQGSYKNRGGCLFIYLFIYFLRANRNWKTHTLSIPRCSMESLPAHLCNLAYVVSPISKDSPATACVSSTSPPFFSISSIGDIFSADI